MNNIERVTVILGICLLIGAGIRENQRVVATYQAPVESRDPEIIPLKVKDAFFFTPIFGDLDKTKVTIPFRFSASPQTLWLYLQANEGTPVISTLVVHPLLLDIKWQKVSSDRWHLYQRNQIYDSVDTFLKNPPQSGIAADPQATLIDSLSPLEITSINQLENLDTIDYILTTYSKLEKEDDWYIFSTNLDATNALKNNDQLSWHLEAPNITPENPYSIQTIKVDYN